MRSVWLVPLLFVTLMAQTEVYDIAAYTPPRGWKAERRQSSIAYTDIDPAARTSRGSGMSWSGAAFRPPRRRRTARSPE